MACKSKLIIFKIVIFILTLVSGECPSKCHCTKYKTFCFLAQLNTLPSALSNTTEHLIIELDQIFQINTNITTYSSLYSLIHLELISVNLQEIQVGAFQKMSQLEYLVIVDNNITLLKTNSFIYLENLYFLDLKDNEISNLESGTFFGLSNLRHLYLDGNNIIILGANIFEGMKTTTNCDIINIPIYQNSSNNTKNKTKPKILDNLCSFIHFNVGLDVTKEIPYHISFGMTVESFNSILKITYKNIKPGSSGLLYLDLANAEISKLTVRSFQNLNQLTYLDISYNDFMEIPRGTFEGLISLKVLKINNNNIPSINNGAFHGLVSLKWLQMINCMIITIENNAFEGLSKLQLLDLSDNYSIRVLNNYTFSGLHMLKHIKLFLYNVQHVDKNSFSVLRNLKSLSNTYKIDRSGFHQDVEVDLEVDLNSGLLHPSIIIIYYPIFKIISYLKLFNRGKEMSLNLTRLDRLEFFPYLCLPQDMQVLKSVHLFIDATHGNYQQDMLNLMRTLHYVKNFNVTLVDVNSTEILKIFSDFQISSLTLLNSDLKFLNNESFIGFSTTKSLTVHDNNTHSISKNAFHEMQSLTDLTLFFKSNVVLEKGSFYGLSNLTHLSILSFPETYFNKTSKRIKMGAFLELHNLKTLELAKNQINCLSPGAFHGLYNIEEINLEQNYINEINARVFGAVCHEEFQLSCKNVTLQEYCNNTNALKTLKYLNLAYNKIAYIHPHAFIACNNLQSLNLKNNEFLTLDNSFLFIPALRELDMIECNITNIPDNTFKCTPLLSEIHFDFNKELNKLTLNSVFPLKHLLLIELAYTSLLCDCELYETWLWFHQHHIVYEYEGFNSNNKSYCGDRDIDTIFVNMDCNITREQISVNKNFTNIRDDFEFFKLYIEPTVLIIILIFGLACNGFLLFISLRHSDMHTKHNVLVIHLAIVDVLSLILNLPLSYWDTVNITWEFDDTLCKIFTITKDIMAGVVVLSVVALSIERFLVAKTFKNLKKDQISENLPTTWLLMMTWLSGIVTSLPAYFSAIVVDGRCLYCPPGNLDYFRNVWTFQLLMYCLVPAVVITFLNIKTSLFLRESVRKIPGEIKYSIHAQNRITVANIVLILAAVFVISYLPNYILRVLVAWSIIQVENVFLVSFITFCLFFSNTVFNPISLFIMSSKYKSHILIYFPLLGNK